MKLLFSGKQIAEITTNHSVTVKEALYCHGYDIDDQDDCDRAYENDEPFAYRDDDGVCCIDLDALDIKA